MSEKIRTLQALLERVTDNSLLDCHVCLPAKVTKYDYILQKASVQPLIKRRFKDETSQTLPEITDVPVGHLKATDCFIHIPVKVGDTVMLHFVDYSMDNYLVSGGLVESEDMRNHTLSDCYAVPMVSDFSNTFTPENADDLIIKNKDLMINVKNNGKIKISNESNEFIDLVHQLCVAVESITTMTGIGLQPPLNKTTFTTLKAKLETFKE